MIKFIKYITDEFLKSFKQDFSVNYAHLYTSNDVVKLRELFANPHNVITTNISYEFEPLEIEPREHDAELVRRNIRRVWNSLSHLTPVQAEMEKIWVALAHTDYLDYQLGIYQSQIANGKNPDQSLRSRTIFISGAKRSLALHNLALLWWLNYYFYDKGNIINPFHLIDFLVSTPYRGNAVVLLSSNIISNKEIALGVLESVKFLAENKGLSINRYSFSEAGRILNEIGGVRILDTLTRDEIRAILIEHLPKSKKVTFVDRAAEILEKATIGREGAFNFSRAD